MNKDDTDFAKQNPNSDWQSIRVKTSEDGTYITLLDQNSRSKLADAIRAGGESVVLGSGKQICTFDFDDAGAATRTNTTPPGQPYPQNPTTGQTFPLNPPRLDKK